jgi:hypothetical protein
MNPQVLVVVRVKSPWWAPKRLIARRFADAVPEYAAAPGLGHKSFTFIDGFYGGVYEWRSRAQAEAWFDARWHARVRRQRGVEGDVRLFDVLAHLVHGPLEGAPLPRGGVRAAAVVTQVDFAGAGAADAARLLAWAGRSEMRRTSVVAVPGGLGVVSLWRSRREAVGFLGERSLSEVAPLARARPQVLVFEAPVVLDPSWAASGARLAPAAT